MKLKMLKFIWAQPKIIIKSLFMIISSIIILVSIVIFLDNVITLNVSVSEPMGYYLKLPATNIQRGQKYLICVTNSRHMEILKQLGLPHQTNTTNQCSGNLPYLIKQVAAISGDSIAVTPNGVLINNKLQPNSSSFSYARGVNLAPLPISYKTILHKNEYFMLGITPHSVDSRYFGIVKRNQIYKQVILIFRKP